MDRDALIRAAVEALDEPGALHVLADRLLLAEDPAGELIARETVRKVARKRSKDLEDAVRARWLGPLADVVDGRRVGFSRGVPSRLVLRRKAQRLRVDDPLWPLIETLDLDRARPAELAELLARMPRLTRIEGALPQIVVAHAGPRRPAALRSLGCYLGSRRTAAGRYVTGGTERDAAAVLAVDPALVELRQGDTFEAASYRWLWETPLGRRLERVSVSNINDRLVWGALAFGAWWRELAQAPPALQELALTEHDDATFEPRSGWCIRFARDPSGRLGAVRAHYELGRSRILDPFERLAGGLAELAPRTIASFALASKVPPHVRRSASFARVERELDRLGCDVDLA